MIPVKDYEIKKTDMKELVKQMGMSGGFTSKKLAAGVDILKNMVKDKDSLNFLSFPADIISTGTRGIIRDMIKEKWFDVVITTCGTLDHDLARSFKEYYHGSFDMDDVELHKKGINRLGNILIPNDSYGIIIEEKMRAYLKELPAQQLSTYELVWEIGRHLKQDSIMHWCWKNKIPMIVPGITDGAVGYQLWQYSQTHKIFIDVLKDEKLLSDLVWNAKKSGALIIGGGISKHHVIWWNQFKHGLDYAVYLTTAQEYDGSLSGARPKEAISWGKLKENAKHVTVEGDATITLPLMYASLV